MDIAERILFEDNHLIAVNKLSGEISQGDKTGDEPLGELVKAYIKKKYNKPGAVYLGVIHRIDRPTSGILLFARTSKALSRMNQQFKEKEVSKTYWAITQNCPSPKAGELKHFLKKMANKNISRAYPKSIEGSKFAELEYRVRQQSDRYHLLEVLPKTGRHHQIRVQLSSISCPIKGDLKYGAKRPNPDRSISLHARKINFLHPVRKEPIEIVAPVPADKLWQVFEKAD